MDQKIREIISTFIKVPADQIGPSTRIDRSTVQSSILLHRMYARLLEAGLAVENYAAVKVFGDLPLNGSVVLETASDVDPVPYAGQRVSVSGAPAGVGVGIDIEEIAALPRATDFRKEPFYKMNFTPSEIAYCILQSDPYSSFAGLFAAKEAIVKADGSNREKAFNTMEIDHSPEGKPLHPVYGISISHAGGMAVAVAVAASGVADASFAGGSLGAAGFPAGAGGSDVLASAGAPVPASGGSVNWMVWMAMLVSIIALLIVLFR